ncbi:D-glycero-beta-D-manno-heptose 1-phosphate adenylyltransferase [Streptomyces poonensis]|uniref:D-glycero-beta-D-manno-heptose 1-phosphate adenylyltransferase n=1 Tax=Streptomyces poonensis TaxID=68255 RepID=A0A918UTQ5_9ACTN|nr:D-glycero-beta-D-manno-heptose 1-phosphate adenylyltransferase [Streptomyces poonensis]GGZ32454.1 bifunctional protein HldE [Streptomyces poonensis]GLJ92828.1 bifunctional protein HldE [Streptomyces poonensis]
MADRTAPPRAGRAPLLVVGDALLDRDLTGTAERLAPDAPVPVVADCAERVRPGGAALAACLAARDGRDVTLVTGLGDDPAGRALRRLLEPWVHVIALPLSGSLPEKTRVLAQGQPVLRLDRGSGRAHEATDEARRALRSARAVLVADYGRGAADALRDTLAESPPAVWDPHPRGGAPVQGTRLVTPSAREARRFAAASTGPTVPTGPASPTGPPSQAGPETPPETGPDPRSRAGGLRTAAQDAATLVRRWRAGAVAVTLGARGALLSYGDCPLLVPAPEEHHGDSCGAGDRFAATAAGLLAEGALTDEAVAGAVAAATAFVAAGGAGALTRTDAADGPAGPATATGTEGHDPHRLVARVRAAGGTVVAAGGCFDLLHAGHVGLLQAARRIGDCLVVCVNSDASVRRRKGDGRPVTPLADRVRVLRALECVDAVAVFDEDTPERLLGALRPDVWVKGGDYARGDLPEAALLESWGGQTVLLPYLDGRSTTRLAARAAASVTAGGGAP